MKNKTDLLKIKEVANKMLSCDIIVDDELGILCHHPFFSTTFQGGIKGKIWNIAIPEDEKEAKAYYKHIIEEAKTLTEIVIFIQKPYLPEFMKMCEPYLSDKDMAEMLADVWIRTEFPNADPVVSQEDFIRMFRKADAEYLMSEEEREVLDALPNEISIYRGTHADGTYRALSWTTDKNIAEWFATRFTNEGLLFSAKVKKEDILAYFEHEKEVVVDSLNLREINIEEIQREREDLLK